MVVSYSYGTKSTVSESSEHVSLQDKVVFVKAHYGYVDEREASSMASIISKESKFQS